MRSTCVFRVTAGLGRSCGLFSAAVAVMLLSASFAQGQNVLVSEIDLPFALPGNPQPTLRIRTTSTAMGVEVGGVCVTTVEERVGFIDFGDPSPCTDVTPEFADADFEWFSQHATPPFFPKLWDGKPHYHDDPPACVIADAVQSWQTTGAVETGAGVIFVFAAWDTDGPGNTMPAMVGSTPGMIAGNATSWVMSSAPPPVPPNCLASSASLTATLGVHAEVKLVSSVRERAGRYIYTYVLANAMEEKVLVSWAAASLEISLAPLERYMHSIVSAHPAQESQGHAIVDGGPFSNVTMVANAFVPADEE